MRKFWEIEQAAKELLSCKYVDDLANLLKLTKKELSLHALSPKYHEFTVPKKDGSKRYIEAPSQALKQILKKLNHHLQSVYFLMKPKASYGYVINYKGNKKPNNILTNAQKHLNFPYLINVDFEDFFHQVTVDKVKCIFENPPFHFTKRSVELLANLCCYMERLPMGSPTSPVLSNFYAISLDIALEKWAKTNQLMYTRFVDDLSFSASSDITAEQVKQIQKISNESGLYLNHEKTKKYGPADDKIVTGLLVSDKVRLPGEFFYELDQDIKRLDKTMETSVIMNGNKQEEFIKEFQQEIEGKLNFMEMILGDNSKKYQEYHTEYIKAITPDVERLSVRWMNFHYIQD